MALYWYHGKSSHVLDISSLQNISNREHDGHLLTYYNELLISEYKCHTMPMFVSWCGKYLLLHMFYFWWFFFQKLLSFDKSISANVLLGIRPGLINTCSLCGRFQITLQHQEVVLQYSAWIILWVMSIRFYQMDCRILCEDHSFFFLSPIVQYIIFIAFLMLKHSSIQLNLINI